MVGNQELVYTISREALNMVKKGHAVLSSGGVRDHAGKLIELAKPAVKKTSGNLSSPITLVSSLANNIQSGFIQKGVNQANTKLDISLDKMEQIQSCVNSLAKTNVLNWINCGIGIANCGITIAGFQMTLKRLNEVSEQIQELKNYIDNNDIENYLRLFRTYKGYINSDINYIEDIQKKNLSIIQDRVTAEHLEDIKTYLEDIIDAFKNRKIDGELGCTIIFNLGIAFAKEVNAYSAQYYYETGKTPPNYDAWIAVLESINSPSFKEHLKQYLFFECPQMKIEDKYSTFSTAIFTIENQLGELSYTQNLITQISHNEFINFDEFLIQRIHNNQYYEFDDKICILLSN